MVVRGGVWRFGWDDSPQGTAIVRISNPVAGSLIVTLPSPDRVPSVASRTATPSAIAERANGERPSA